MKITYLAHACFLLENQSGGRLIADRFGPIEGSSYPVPDGRADVATFSHAHFDHDFREGLSKGCQVLDQPGHFQCAGFEIDGIESFHDEFGGAKRGKNIIYVIGADGLRVAHLGDLGHELDNKQLALLGHIDVLLIPVGGTYTLDAQGAARVAKRVGARVTIPMHYKTEGIGFDIESEHPFLQQMGEYRRAGEAQIDVTPENIHALPPVLVLSWR